MDPHTLASVHALKIVEQKDWSRQHFQKLLQLYKFGNFEIVICIDQSNTPADKFMKSIKTSFLYEKRPESATHRSNPKISLSKL